MYYLGLLLSFTLPKQEYTQQILKKFDMKNQCLYDTLVFLKGRGEPINPCAYEIEEVREAILLHYDPYENHESEDFEYWLSRRFREVVALEEPLESDKTFMIVILLLKLMSWGFMQ